MTQRWKAEKENNSDVFMIEQGEKIAAVACWPFQKRAVIMGSYGRRNPGDTCNKTNTRGEQHKGYLVEEKGRKRTNPTEGETEC